MKGDKIHAYSSKDLYWVPNLWQAGNVVGLKDTVGSTPPRSLYSNENKVKIKIKDHFTKWEAVRWCDWLWGWDRVGGYLYCRIREDIFKKLTLFELRPWP